MDPQLKSILTSVGLSVAGAIVGWAVKEGLVTQDQAASLTTALVTVGTAAVGAALIWYKAHQHSQKVMIQAVNEADNGVKVVASTAVAPPVNGPLK